MLIAGGDIWNYDGIADAICITTNGCVNSSGLAVMGRGVALQAKQKFKGIDHELGRLIREKGNIPHILGVLRKGSLIVSFPVKPAFAVFDGRNAVEHIRRRWRLKEGDKIPGWAAKADVELIYNSAKILKKMTDEYCWRKVVLPCPGCGAGEVGWTVVKAMLEDLFDDRFIIVDKKKLQEANYDRQGEDYNFTFTTSSS